MTSGLIHELNELPFQESSLGSLHTYSNAAGSVLNISGLLFRARLYDTWENSLHLLFGSKVVQPCWNICLVVMNQMLANVLKFQSSTQSVSRSWLQVLKVVP